MNYLDLRRIKPVKAEIENDKIIFEKNISIHSTMDDLVAMSLGLMDLFNPFVMRAKIYHIPSTSLLMMVNLGMQNSPLGSLNEGRFIMNYAELSGGRETSVSKFIPGVPWVSAAEEGIHVTHLSEVKEKSPLAVNKIHSYNDRYLEFTIRK